MSGAGLAKAYVTLNVQGDGKAPAAGGVAKAVEEAKCSQPLAPNSDGGMYWDERCAPPPATAHADALAHDGLALIWAAVRSFLLEVNNTKTQQLAAGVYLQAEQPGGHEPKIASFFVGLDTLVANKPMDAWVELTNAPPTLHLRLARQAGSGDATTLRVSPTLCRIPLAIWRSITQRWLGVVVVRWTCWMRTVTWRRMRSLTPMSSCTWTWRDALMTSRRRSSTTT